MVKVSSEPNVRGIKNVSSSMELKSTVIGRQGRLFAGLLDTRVKGIAYGIIIAMVFMVVIPAIAKACGL